MGYFNARSLNMDCKFAEILNVINGIDFHFIAVTETWLKPWISSNSVHIPGFVLLRNDRVSHSGGVAIYVRDSVKWKMVDKSSSGDIEFLFIQAYIDNNWVLVGVIYNVVDGNVEYIDNLLSIHVPNYEHVLIAGDFNINMLRSNSTTNSFKNALEAQNLQYLPKDQPTRYCDFYNSASLLDLIITSSSTKIDKLIQLELSFLDHDVICFSYCLPTISSIDLSYKYRCYRDINYGSLFANCLSLNWDLILEKKLIDDKVLIFNDFIYYLFDTHVPIKTFIKRRNMRPEWFNKQIELAIIDREVCYKLWRHEKTDENRVVFLRCRRNVKRLIRSAKSAFIKRQLDPKLPSRKLWNNIRSIGLSQDNPACPQLSADELNLFFINSVPQSIIKNSTISIEAEPSNACNFDFNTVDSITVAKALNGIKSNAIGDDGIPLKFIKIIIPLIFPYICHIIDECLVRSVFPSQWKVGMVIPVPKVAHASNLCDMRPISILPVLSKVLELVMRDQIMYFLNKQNLLTQFQSGFRPKHSTATAMLKITDDISSALDLGHVVLLVLLDFSKAFDTLNHSILLRKLRLNFNFSCQAAKLIKHYLSHRMQYVKYNGKVSSVVETERGVPQGSVLGPLLFSMFINDIVSVINHCHQHLYADDIQIYLNGSPDSIDSLAVQVNGDLGRISNWTKDNEMHLNLDKTKVLRIYRGKVNIPFPSITIDNHVLSYTSKARNLGFILNSELSWAEHVNHICSCIYSGLKRLSKFRHSTPIGTKKALAHSLLVSHILYSDFIIGKLDYESNRRLVVAFNSITRYVYNISRYDHITPYAKCLLGCTIENYLKYRQCIMLFNIIQGNCPEYLKNKIRCANSLRYVTLITPVHKSVHRATFFFIYGAQNWNSLSPDIKRISHPSQFKTRCYDFFSSR